MSVWEYAAAVDGWIEANCPGEAGKLTPEDEDDLWAMVQAKMG
uniref:Uncharacterized protein n=1 Tax=Cereibacter sphaeroides (strain ATCC 17025 / ATH 2.4.3) TaxID=349102 RepID=A4WTD9_CERS5